MRFRRAVTAVAGLALVGAVAPVISGAPAQAVECNLLSPCVAPVASIDTAYGTPVEAGDFNETHSTSATFRLEVTSPTDLKNVTYECMLEKIGGTAGQLTACTMPVTYPGLTLGKYKFSARAIQNPGLGGQQQVGAVDTYLWDVVPRPAGALPGDPQTTLANVPARWHTANWFSVDLRANEPVSRFVCRLDGRVRSCGLRQFDLFGTGPGDHTISVAAIDMSGNPDTTPAIAKFTVPENADILKRPSGWTRRTGQGFMNDTYLYTTKQGAAIKHGFRGTRKIAAVVSKGPRNGTLKVYVGSRLVKKVSLYAPSVRHRQVVVLKTWKRPTRGVVRLVVASRGKPVYVEGLGFSRR